MTDMNYFVVQAVPRSWVVLCYEPNDHRRNFAGQPDSVTVDSYWESEDEANSRCEFLRWHRSTI